MSEESSEPRSLWVFGYGSLIWKPDIPFLRSLEGHVRGYTRRFYQASRDHRGTDELPGRVVTLMRADDEVVHGKVYEVPAAEVPRVLSYLDHREKCGYDKAEVDVHLHSVGGGSVRALVYMGTPENPDFAGPDSDENIARLIFERSGPSGPNREYLFQLAEALRRMGVVDEHVFRLESLVREREREDASTK